MHANTPNKLPPKTLANAKTKSPITTELIVGYNTELITLNFKYLLTINTTITTDKEINAEAIATPLKPKATIINGVSTHVVIVQNTIKYRVVLIFPIAFKAFVKGVETEDKAEVIDGSCAEGIEK